MERDLPFSLETDLPRLLPMPLIESEKRLEACESIDALEERSSEDVLVGAAGLDWLRLRKLLLPIRLNRPRGCAAAPAAVFEFPELASLA